MKTSYWAFILFTALIISPHLSPVYATKSDDTLSSGKGKPVVASSSSCDPACLAHLSCVNGSCVLPTANRTCSTSRPCPDGVSCVNGKCASHSTS